MIQGIIIAIVFIVLCGSFNIGSNVWYFMLCVTAVQFGLNWASGPYAGLLPDLVPIQKIGLASGILAFSGSIGNLTGMLVSGLMTNKQNYWPVYIVLASIFSIFCIPTLIGIKEPSKSHRVEKLTLISFVKQFYLDPRVYRDFYWVILARAMEQMGVASFLPYFQFYLMDVVHVERPEFMSSMMLGILVMTAIPSSVIAGKLSDRWGRKLMVYISSVIMTVCMILFVLNTFSPSIWSIAFTASLMGIGYGAFIAVDWALALDTIPSGASVAKDMGLWHVSIVFPQVISPMISGFLLNKFKMSGSLITGYIVVCTITATWFGLATLCVYPIQPKKANHNPLTTIEE